MLKFAHIIFILIREMLPLTDCIKCEDRLDLISSTIQKFGLHKDSGPNCAASDPYFSFYFLEKCFVFQLHFLIYQKTVVSFLLTILHMKGYSLTRPFETGSLVAIPRNV